MATSMDKHNAQPVYWQHQCILSPKNRGFHLITDDLRQAMADMPPIHTGLINFFLQHTSASLTLSENTCPDVALDLETYFNQLIPDDNRLYRHTLEGEDDMPAHLKNVMLGASLVIPLHEGKMALGQWQGILLCEHRNQAPTRKIIITAHGLVA
jgi:secondary thiamine-phosphate synthase enzyme